VALVGEREVDYVRLVLGAARNREGLGKAQRRGAGRQFHDIGRSIESGLLSARGIVLWKL
jgi:hypothetical protein